MIETQSEAKSKTFPVFSTGLLVFFVILFLISNLVVTSQDQLFLERLWGGSGNKIYEILGGSNRTLTLNKSEFWRLLSAPLLHSGIIHLGLNVWSLWNMGSQIETKFSWREFCLVFFIGSAVGLILSAGISGYLVVSIGAGAGICGFIGFLTTQGANNFIQIEKQFVDNRNLILLNIVLPFMFPNWDAWGNIGGVASGLVLGFLYRNPPQSIRQVLGLSSGLLLLAGAGIIVFQALKIGF
jgi:rhomboid protease GluP